jgi:transcriptional regulator with XRE-family HTH domain
MPDSRRFRNDPALAAQGMATKLEIALTLVAARTGVGLSQAELARRAGWKPQFACRLESVNGRLPNLTSILAYGRACHIAVGLLFSVYSENGLQVVRGLTLQSTEDRRVFELLTGREIRCSREFHQRTRHLEVLT